MTINSSNKTFRAILLTGFTVGVLDGLAAVIPHYEVGPVRIFQYIASGLFGSNAYASDTMAIWGLFFHFMIACALTTVYFLLYPGIAFLERHRIVSGFIYGVLAWTIMNYVIVPLSSIGMRPFVLKDAVQGIFIHTFLVGLPIALMAYRHYSQRSAPDNK